MKNTIIIVDDDKELCKLIERCVQYEGYISNTFHFGKEAIEVINGKSDVIVFVILDIMLPDISGLDILSSVRDKYNFPIMMLTAKDSETDKVLGLRLGADDYLTKPFSLEELRARISSHAGRYRKLLFPMQNQEKVLSYKNITIDPMCRTVIVNNKIIELTATEYDILFFLASNKGRVYTKRQIYEAIWNEDYLCDDNNIMTLICKIRRKIEKVNNNIEYIQTVRGIGYRFNKGV